MLCHRHRKLKNHRADTDSASHNTVCDSPEDDDRHEAQISQIEYKVPRHWAANIDAALREALRAKYVRLELQWLDGEQPCRQKITFEWVIREEDGELVVVLLLPDVATREIDPAQAHMPSCLKMGLPDPPSYMHFNTDRLVELYPPSELMPDWLFAGMGVLGSKHLQRFMRKRNERYGILVSCMAMYRISIAKSLLTRITVCTRGADRYPGLATVPRRRFPHRTG